ncbi:hypothetical protein Emin_0559 [Elusimicrobium minutum Pei191]|uniref:Uncharacterized protein n=1 Tax=Elusimicrobium minutum (strain Pei191) TaxID=445932 RepID=B2KCJ3_ELUMP|nr:hypothetical protein [Elusimicrobium minutum]ACC98114.1 hypothetical protein Emin_0559 [Elusimicrobium minutum Pei191]
MKARCSKAIIWTKRVKDTMEKYYMAHDVYATDFSQLDVEISNVKPCGINAIFDIYEGGKSVGDIWYFSSVGRMLEMFFTEDTRFGELQYYMMLDNSDYKGERYCGFYGNTTAAKEKAGKIFSTSLGGKPAPAIAGYSTLHVRYLLP